MPEWITPELWPVWCVASFGSFSRRTSRRGGARSRGARAGAGPPGPTIPEADNVFFSCLTMNPQPLHVDFHAAAKAEFGKPIVNSLFTLGVAVGLSVGETTLGTTVGNLGFEKGEFPKPVFHGDTIYAETEVVEKRESRSRPQWGIVIFEHRAQNQPGGVVMCCRRAAMMRRRVPGPPA